MLAFEVTWMSRIYSDVPPFMGIKLVTDLTALESCDAAIQGVPFDGVATFRGGATRIAPQTVRKFSMLFTDYCVETQVTLSDLLVAVDIGDVDIVPGNTSESFRRIQERTNLILAKRAVPLSIGGDHSITLPIVKAISQRTEGKIGVVQFDTHMDLVDDLSGDRFTRASPMKRLLELENVDPHRAVQIGIRGYRNDREEYETARRIGSTIYTIDQVHEEGIQTICKKALQIATKDTRGIYVTFDIDVVDPAYAPGTNSPDPNGFTSREAILALRTICKSALLGFDLVEIAPEYDIPSGITSILGARLLAEVLNGLALAGANSNSSGNTTAGALHENGQKRNG